MKHLAKFRDALQGTVSISDNKKKYFKTKDSTSSSGHSIVAKIAMTHSGIVTKNYGFYMPGRMRDGATSFTDGFYKPVIVGHDENPLDQAEPVGRVIDASYIDTANEFIQKDSYLKSLFSFQDKKSKGDKILDFVHHIIDNYEGGDGYQGLGYIEGLLKITDEEAIQKILDERYLTVSTSMMSDSATCSVCGTDWVRDGKCEHQRGAVYSDKVCVVIPGRMEYDHLGIVNAPADPHAHTFTVVNTYNDSYDIEESDDLFKYHDEVDFAASLFAYKDKEIVSLSSKEDVNLVTVKDSIQRMENAMAGKKKTTTKKPLEQTVQDSISVSMRAFRYGEEGKDDMEIQVSQYMSEASEEAMKKLSSKVMGLLDSSKGTVTTEMIDEKLGEWLDAQHALLESEEADEDFLSMYNDAKDGYMKKKKKKKSKDSEDEDEDEDEDGEEDDSSMAHKKSNEEGMKKKKKKAKKMSDSFKLEDADELSEEDVETALSALDADSEISKEFSAVDRKKIAEIFALKNTGDHIAEFLYGDCESVLDVAQRYRDSAEKPSLNEVTAEQAVEMMNEHLEEDSKITEETEFKASDYCGMRGYFPVVDEATYKAALEVVKSINMADSVRGRILCAIEKKAEKLQLAKNFDSQNDSCDNKPDVSVESMLAQYSDLREKLVEAGHSFEDEVVSQDSEQEIEILESQLEAANEDIEELEGTVGQLTDSLVEQLAIRLVDMKILSGNYDFDDRAAEITSHRERTLESLKDGIKDLEAQVNITELKLNDGLANKPEDEVDEEGVTNPVLDSKDSKAGTKVKVKDSKEKDKKDSGEVNKMKIYDAYRAKCRTYGKPEADKWLRKIQKRNKLISTLD
jgi:hypothetical protein